MKNNRKGTGKFIAALLLSVILLGSFFVAAPASADYIPQNPKEDIITVVIWDEVTDDVTYLHVTYYTKKPSDPGEVSISLEGDNYYGTAVHPDSDNKFYHKDSDSDILAINMDDYGFETGDSISLYALASWSGNTDRAPNDGFYEYVFGTGNITDPVTFDDTDDKAAHKKGEIKEVVIKDEVIDDHTVLHVTFNTKEESGDEITGRLEDSEGNTYDATHSSGTNEFYVDIDFAGIRTTEETISLFVETYGSEEEFDIDRAPKVGYYEHTFSAKPPTIDIEKATNGQDADTEPGPGILVGSPVAWTYVVTNTGNFPLTSVVITDDQLGQIGDTIPSLAVGASVTRTASGTAEPGQYGNVGTVTGTPPGGLADVFDTDPSHYLGVDSGIDIEKATNGEDADTEPGPEILAGSPVTWTYVVTNTGNAELTNVVVTDDQLGEIDTIPSLAAGESVTLTFIGTAEPGQYGNMGTVTGTPPGGLTAVSATDPSHYLGTTPPYPLGGPTSRVYNAATGDPVPGATVTLFYSATGDAGSFVQVDEDNPPPTIYPAVNPQTTDLDGHYGWMVSEGYYYVHAEKAGFSPKDGLVVSASSGVATLNIGLDPLPFIAPKQLKEQALAAIIDYNKVIKHIQKSLDDKYWEDDSHLTKKGKKVFEEEEKAVKELMKIEKKDSSVSPTIGFLVEADRLLAQIAIDDAVDASGDAKKIAKAEKEIAKAQKDIAEAQKDIDKGKYDKAIDHYRKAWEHAQKAT